LGSLTFENVREYTYPPYFKIQVLGVTENNIVWILARLLTGCGAAMALVVGSTIVISDIIMRGVFYYGGNWKDAYIIIAIAGAFFSYYSVYVYVLINSCRPERYAAVFLNGFYLAAKR